MINYKEENGLRIIESSTGYFTNINRTSTYEGKIYLGKYDSQNNYVEITLAEKQAIEEELEKKRKDEENAIKETDTEPSVVENAVVRVVQEYPYVDKQGVKHNDKIRHYAVDDQGNRYKMKCSGLVALVDEAIDDFPCKYVYKATNIRVEK